MWCRQTACWSWRSSSGENENGPITAGRSLEISYQIQVNLQVSRSIMVAVPTASLGWALNALQRLEILSDGHPFGLERKLRPLVRGNTSGVELNPGRRAIRCRSSLDTDPGTAELVRFVAFLAVAHALVTTIRSAAAHPRRRAQDSWCFA